jgi:hypothetical protein
VCDEPFSDAAQDVEVLSYNTLKVFKDEKILSTPSFGGE